MNKDLYSMNLEYLKRRSSSATFAHIAGTLPEATPYTVTETGNGSLVFEAGEEDKVQIHSRRDPEGEAIRQVSSWIEKTCPDLNGLVAAPGFGGMYHIKELLSRLKPGGVLLILEKNPVMIRKALDYCDLTKLECPEGTCVIFAVSESDEELRREYRHYLQTMKTLKVSVFIHPGLSRAFPGHYESLVSELKRESDTELMERKTRIALSPKWTEHAICNLPAILNSPGLNALKDFYPGQSAIVIAAGPSLDECTPYIRDLMDKAIIITVGRALKSLTANGIKPDFVIHADSDFKSIQQFDGVDCNNLVLLTELISYPEVVSKFAGNRFFFSTGAARDIEDWLKSGGGETGRICAGGTVALSAIDAARYMGCRKIFFLGLDLAFAENGTTHAKETTYKGKESFPGTVVQVKGNYKDKVSAPMQYASYIYLLNSYLEDIQREGKNEFFNVNTQGAALSHCKLIKPSEMILNIEGETKINRPLEKPQAKTLTEKSGRKNWLEHIRKSIDELKSSAMLAGEMTDACTEADGKLNYGDQEEKLPETEKRIKKMELARLLVSGAIQGLLTKTNQQSAETLEGDQSELVKDFYTKYKGACEWVAALLEEAEKHYKNNTELIY